MKQVGLLPFDFPFGRRPLVQGEDNVFLPSQGCPGLSAGGPSGRFYAGVSLLPKVRLNIFDAQLPEVLELRVREAQKAEKTVCELTDEIL